MAHGDVAGAITELVITCVTRKKGKVNIVKWHALKLTGAYEVAEEGDLGEPIFGQALSGTQRNDIALPVKVRGICIFDYTGLIPWVGGKVMLAMTPGIVTGVPGSSARGEGIVLKVDTAAHEVHVLL